MFLVSLQGISLFNPWQNKFDFFEVSISSFMFMVHMREFEYNFFQQVVLKTYSGSKKNANKSYGFV